MPYHAATVILRWKRDIMWIEKIQIKNFGKFHDKSIEFSKGLNVIYGANESGKTTIHSFLIAMLFGIEKSRGRAKREDVYRTYEPWNSASYYMGNMTMQIGGKRFFLERNFYHKEKTAKLRNLEDMEELSVDFGDLEMLLGGITKETYQNTYCIKQAGFLSDATLALALENYMSDVSNTGGGSVRIQAALEELTQKKKAVERERRRLIDERNVAIERLSMEAEILKKDIAEHKNSELMETLAKQQEKFGQSKTKKPMGERKKHWGLLLGLLLLALGGICIRPGGAVRGIGILCMLFALGSCYIAGIRYHKRTAGSTEDKMTAELTDELLLLQEQWKEKENRYYNIEEQLLELTEPAEEEVILEEDEKALELSMETIRKIADRIYDEVSDELHEEVSKNLSNITNGRYDSIILDEELHLFIWENGKKIPVNQLSKGTLEQAYFAMRMAVGDILMQEERMPVLLDETFSMYDDKRLADTLSRLAKNPGQVILFSCQKREMDLLEQLSVPYHKIVLG